MQYISMAELAQEVAMVTSVSLRFFCVSAWRRNAFSAFPLHRVQINVIGKAVTSDP